MDPAVGAVAIGGHRAEEADAGSSHRGCEVEWSGVSRDKQPREPAEAAEILERCLGRDDRRLRRSRSDPLGAAPLPVATPDDD